MTKHTLPSTTSPPTPRAGRGALGVGGVGHVVVFFQNLLNLGIIFNIFEMRQHILFKSGNKIHYMILANIHEACRDVGPNLAPAAAAHEKRSTRVTSMPLWCAGLALVPNSNARIAEFVSGWAPMPSRQG
jgi:hypothetical protein